MNLQLPVYDVATWEEAQPFFESTLSFLSGDEWNLDFATRSDNGVPTSPPREADLVCLFSGGADSLCGAIRALADGYRPILVSHWDWSPHSGIQKRLHHALEGAFETTIPHIQVRLGKRADQLGGKITFDDEPTRRSRSFLFLALGLAVASTIDGPLWVPENGYASLNPPLAPERRGSLSTRTTHPNFFAGLTYALHAVSAHHDFSNPFASATKGEMFRQVADLVGQPKIERLLGLTNSCSHVRLAGRYGFPPETQCGVCFGCLVRRGAFQQSGLHDASRYVVTELNQSDLTTFLNPRRRQDIEAARYGSERGISPADIIGMDLSDGYPIEDALALAGRGLSELGLVVS
jgi:7-cyano-7-deazaguanine synthase in queuosine biosynthesis